MSSEPGSLLLVPVESELLLYRRLASGKLGRKVVSAVRFSELEVRAASPGHGPGVPGGRARLRTRLSLQTQACV